MRLEQMDAYIPIQLADGGSFLLAAVVVAAFVVGRYLLICGAVEAFCYRLEPGWLASRRTVDRFSEWSARRRELIWSLLTSVIFAVSGVALGWMWQAGWTKIYLPFDQYGWWYLPLSWFLYAVVHDAFYYWLHRWMHWPRVYKWMHTVHHESLKPSAWASFSFHPFEALPQAFVLPVLTMLIPIHPVVLLCHLTFMTVSAVSNHLGFEILPRGRFGRWIASWFISGIHHTQHHKYGRSNYGLFFTFWDRWFGTEHPATAREISRIL